MGFDTPFDAERWLGQQSGFIQDLFETAAEELQASGIRLLAGSVPPSSENLDYSKSIKLVPLRFSGSNATESLSLTLLATNRRGPPRYAVVLEVSGTLTIQALRKLAMEHADIWERAYLKTGLWIGEGANTELLNHLSQVTQSIGAKLSITGMFLHSDLSRTIQQGVMVLGVLYRSVLDELSEVSRMGRLYAQLNSHLDNYTPRFERILRP